MKSARPLCYTDSTPFIEAAPGAEPVLPELEIRTLRGLAPKEPWPVDRAAEVEIVFGNYPPPNLEDFPKLRWLQLESAGYSHIFQPAACRTAASRSRTRGASSTARSRNGTWP